MGGAERKNKDCVVKVGSKLGALVGTGVGVSVADLVGAGLGAGATGGILSEGVEGMAVVGRPLLRLDVVGRPLF